MRNTPWRCVLMAAGLVLGIAACGSGTRLAVKPPPITAAPGGGTPGTTCPPPFRTGLSAATLPAGFAPTTAVSCGVDLEPIPGRGQWDVQVERRATTGLGPLVTALRQRSQPQGGACAVPATFVQLFDLIDGAGRAVQPRIPTDHCGEPQQQVLTALNQLPWEIVSTQLVHQVTSQGALDSGCPQQYTDLFSYFADRAVPRTAGPVLNPPPPALRVCVYQDSPADAQGLVVGNFTNGSIVSGQPESTLLDGLSGGRTSIGCPTTHTMFAVVTPATNSSSYAEVELGGCERVFDFAHLDHPAPSRPVPGAPATVPTVRQVDQIGQATPGAVTSLTTLNRP